MLTYLYALQYVFVNALAHAQVVVCECVYEMFRVV